MGQRNITVLQSCALISAARSVDWLVVNLSLKTRLVLAFLLVGVVSTALAGILVDRTVRRLAFDQIEERLKYEVTMTGQMTASALFAPLAPEDTSLRGPITDLAAAVKTQLSVLTPEGIVVADSERPADAAPSMQKDALEVVAARRSGKGSAVRGVAKDARLWVAESVVRDGQTLGIARASVPMSVVEEQVQLVRKRVILAAAVALLISSLIAIALSLGIARPIARLAAAARRIGEGELDTRVEVVSHDEIGDLGKALNDMSGNLKGMIGKLDRQNGQMRLVLDAVSQGLVVVGIDGAIAEERSLRIDEWFAKPSAGAPFWTMLAQISERDREALRLGWQQLGAEFLPAEILLLQLPTRVQCGERMFDLGYEPIPEGDQSCARVLVVISDVTLAVEAERKEEAQKDILRILGHSLRDRTAVTDFLRDADSLVERIAKSADLVEIKRCLHTLKGNCGLQGMLSIAALCHAIESDVEDAGSLGAAERSKLSGSWSSIRLEIDKFVTNKEGVVVDDAEVADVIRSLLADAPRQSIAARMAGWTLAPVQGALSLLGNRAEALAARLGKGSLRIAVEHDGTRLDREAFGPVFSALVHAVRNSVDHGIEQPEEREQAKKPSQPTLTLSARHEGDQFLIEVADDGRGIAWPRIAEKLRALGRPADSHEDLVEGLFLDGMSTADAVTEISGRGVGMAALREVVQSLRGHIEVSSLEGQGTRLTCRFPDARVDVNALLARGQIRRTVSARPPAGPPNSRPALVS